MVQWKRRGLSAVKGFRLAAEYTQFQAGLPKLRAEAPPGDGHPVLVLPGFGASDLSMLTLRWAVREMGYKDHGWEGGYNTGLTDRTVEQLANRLKEVYEENGHQKVSLLGWSMGGIYARLLAQEFPDMVRDVTTMGTPFGIAMNKDGTPAWLVKAIELLSSSKYSMNADGMAERLLTPPPVPTTSIFSKTDSTAGWQACLNPKTRWSENIEVSSSHYGLICSKGVLTVILDRLAQPEGQWKPYKNPSKDTPPPNPKWKPTATSGRIFPKP